MSTFFILLISSAFVYVLFTPPAPSGVVEEEVFIEGDETIEVGPYEYREHIEAVLVVADIFVLLIASIFSYAFARRTLRPIEEMRAREERFMADVAHELRTPLAVMRSGNDTVLRKPRSPQEYERFIRESNDEVKRLAGLTEGLLTLLTNERERAEACADVDFGALARREVARFASYAAERSVSLSADRTEEVIVHADAGSLVQLVQNLLKNAVDYNRPGGTVTVHIVRDGLDAVLSVRDTGVGIAETAQRHVFDRFYKVDEARSDVTRGAGLGLAIARDIARRFGGDIALESAPGAGSTFTVRLPLAHS
ncbi:MAG TPA: HAMP domain-containing sensor histidine kinase [Candidatus Paceibacterota bacterium]|nr:HAMP domain-containing sensor histidine kinase [Candidatus Paceibacterota bacterium]